MDSTDNLVKVGRQLRGSKSRKKGTTNQQKSVQYILRHPEIYGIEIEEVRKSGMLYSKRVHSMINSAYPTPHKDLFTLWDIITMPKWDFTNPGLTYIPGKCNQSFLYLIQVKTKRTTAELILELSNWKVPFYVKKQLHIWQDKADVPEIIDLN